MKDLLAVAGLGPLLLAQGRWARARTLKLPEAAGPREGAAGAGPLLRVLILGDSAAAGVGAVSQSAALSGQLTRLLADQHRVEWKLLAKIGATTATTLVALRGLEGERFDVVLTSLGVNDVTSRRSLVRWLEEQRALREQLRGSFGVRLLIVSGLPPVRGFPALPQPLRWVLGERSQKFDAALRADVAGEPDVAFLPIDFATHVDLIAEDGFHPGPEVYRRWAVRASEIVREWCVRTGASS